MPGIFTKEKTIDINIYYIENVNSYGISSPQIIEEKGYESFIKNNPDKKVEKFETKWLIPNHKINTSIFSNSTYFNSETQLKEFDWTKVRDIRIKTCLIGWNATDDNGQPVLCTPDNIDYLHEKLSLALLEKYEQAITFNKEEISKLRTIVDFLSGTPSKEQLSEEAYKVMFAAVYGWTEEQIDTLTEEEYIIHTGIIPSLFYRQFNKVI